MADTQAVSAGPSFSGQHRQAEEDTREWRGWQNPLHEAVWTNNGEKLKQLVRKSFGPMQQGDSQKVGLEDEENQFTPLYVSSLKNDVNSACILLEAGANVNNGGAQGTPPIFSAAAKGNVELVRLFVAFKCNLDQEDVRQGCSAIHIAADKGHVDVIDVLLDASIDVNKKSTNGEMTPLHHAASCGRLEAVKKLIECGANVNAINTPGNTPLILATNKGHKDVVETLIQNGADVKIHCHRDGFTALHSAACFGYPAIAKVLINAGADVNASYDPFWHTPLHLAAAKGQVDCVALLLDSGAKVNARNKPGATPLRLAASNESELKFKSAFLETAKLLLAAGANINERNDQGNTPLHGLVMKDGSFENIQFCIENGADPTIKNRDGKSCLDIVNNVMVRALLLGEAKKPEEPQTSCNNTIKSSSSPSASKVFMDVVDWMKDADAANCLGCNALFGVFVRKHHCRLCGKIFCHKCSTQRYMGARVCDTCFAHKKAQC